MNECWITESICWMICPRHVLFDLADNETQIDEGRGGIRFSAKSIFGYRNQKPFLYRSNSNKQSVCLSSASLPSARFFVTWRRTWAHRRRFLGIFSRGRGRLSFAGPTQRTANHFSFFFQEKCFRCSGTKARALLDLFIF